MGPLKLNRSIEETCRQVLFLHNFIRSLELRRIKKNFLHILGLTAILAAVSLVSDTGYLIGFYIVLTAVWIIFLISCIFKLLKYRRTKYRLKVVTALEFDRVGDCLLEFNEDRIKVTTEKISSDIKWEYFRAYLEDMSTIYILMNQVNSTLSFSNEEIGEEALQKLKAIVKEKLPLLKTENDSA